MHTARILRLELACKDRLAFTKTFWLLQRPSLNNLTSRADHETKGTGRQSAYRKTCFAHLMQFKQTFDSKASLLKSCLRLFTFSIVILTIYARENNLRTRKLYAFSLPIVRWCSFCMLFVEGSSVELFVLTVESRKRLYTVNKVA